MSNRMEDLNPTREEAIFAAAKFLKTTPGAIQAKISFLLEEGIPVPDLIAAIKLAANVQVVATVIGSPGRPKQNWRMN